jgi:plastocyanin
MMMPSVIKLAGVAVLISSLAIPLFLPNASSEAIVPEWIKNTAKWYGDGLTSEQDFLNAIKFLIENDILIINGAEQDFSVKSVIIPNGNSLQGNVGYYIPLNLEIKVGSTVVWENNDGQLHTVQSQDIDGTPTGLFTSSLLQTGDSYEFKFTEPGEHHYYCTLHPWRVGVITVK